MLLRPRIPTLNPCYLNLPLLFLMVPSNGKRLQADEAVGVLLQLDGIPIQSHLVHVGPDVVTGVASAERLISYCGYVIVLQMTHRKGHKMSDVVEYSSFSLSRLSKSVIPSHSEKHLHLIVVISVKYR